MKKLTIAIFSLLSFTTLFADEKKVETKIEEVTVYLQYARISNTAMVSIPAGTSDVVLTQISNNVNASSIQIMTSNDVTLMSVGYRTNYLDDPKINAQLKQWKDSVEMLNDKITELNEQVNVLQSEETMIKANNKLGGANNGCR